MYNMTENVKLEGQNPRNKGSEKKTKNKREGIIKKY